MRTRITGLANREGSVLMVTLFAAVLIGTVLASYLALIRHQDVAVARSQGWNAALAVAEAGVEEALAQMNAGVASSSIDLSANGWGPPAGGYFNLQSRTLSSGRYYDVLFFTNSASPNPTIYSTGYVTIPALSATVERKIKVSTKTVPLINVAVAATYGITMASGSGFSADSFNSAEPAHSDNGRYPGSYPSRVLTNGDVASVYGPLGFGDPTSIKGDLYLGPAATNSIAANQVSGGIHTDFNFDYPEVAAPADAPYWPVKQSTNGVEYDFNSSGDWMVTDSKKIVVRPGVKVQLYVTTTNFSPSRIRIESNGHNSGTLIIYQRSGSAMFPRGSGPVIEVESERAENFWYFGMADVTSVEYQSGGYDVYGVIYAPSANLILHDGWHDMKLMGACVARTIKLHDRYNFHFDENLLKSGPIRGYAAGAWKEL